MFGILTFHLGIPGCTSLKEKRGRLKPFLARLHRQFNVSAAEMGLQDKWQEAVVCCGMVGNDRVHLEQSLQAIVRWVEGSWRDIEVLDEKIELI